MAYDYEYLAILSYKNSPLFQYLKTIFWWIYLYFQLDDF